VLGAEHQELLPHAESFGEQQIHTRVRNRVVRAHSQPYPSVLTAARRLCDHLASIKSAGVRPAPNLSRTKVGTGVPKRITGDAVPRRDKDGGMTRPERVFVF